MLIQAVDWMGCAASTDQHALAADEETKRVASYSGTDFVERDSTAVFLDWDDTLFPTSWQNRAFPQSSAEYAECVKAAAALIRTARSVGDVVIVTLAREEWVTWAANKRFEISKFKFKFPRARTYELIRARSRLYRSQSLQVNSY